MTYKNYPDSDECDRTMFFRALRAGEIDEQGNPIKRKIEVKKTYRIEVEYTDTFGGEPNYCWVKRATLEIPDKASDQAIMRRAKAAVGLSGVRGRGYSCGGIWEFRPYRSCSIMMAQVVY